MIKSMTGFGRGSIIENGRSFVVEIKSVNHRYLDLNIKMPRSYLSLEEKIRDIIKAKLNRGKVDVYINLKVFQREDMEAVLNKALAESYMKCFEEIRNNFEVREDITIANLARMPEVINLDQKEEDLDMIWSILKKPIEEALDAHVEMRKREGQKLNEDILKKCSLIEELVTKIEKKADTVVVNYRNKLNDRLKELLDDVKFDENRVAMEVAIFADKCSVDEEIVRLKSHISQIRETMDLKEPIGRKLDFIVQEMNREANTIASKANDLDITKNILQVKSEIEKIREQTQNVE